MHCDTITDFSRMNYDPVNHRMLLFGGGHAATGRTDIDAFDLRGLRWASLYPSMTCREVSDGKVDLKGFHSATGHPVARHTYDMSVVAKVDDEFYLLLLSNEGEAGICHRYRSPIQSIASYSLTNPSRGWRYGRRFILPWHYAAAAEYDPVSGMVIVVGPNNRAGEGGMWVYNPSTEHVTFVDHIGYHAIHNDLVYYPPNRKMYLIDRENPRDVWELALDRKNWARSRSVQLTTTGDAPDASASGYGYDSEHRIIGGGIQDGVFHAFNPENRHWTARTMEVSSKSAKRVGTGLFHVLDFDPVNGVFLFLAADASKQKRLWAYRYQPVDESSPVAEYQDPPDSTPSEPAKLPPRPGAPPPGRSEQGEKLDWSEPRKARRTENLNVLKRRLKNLLMRFTENHPDVRYLRDRIDNLEHAYLDGTHDSHTSLEPATPPRGTGSPPPMRSEQGEKFDWSEPRKAHRTEDLNALRRRLKDLLTRFTENHPDVRSLRDRIANLEHADPNGARDGHTSHPQSPSPRIQLPEEALHSKRTRYEPPTFYVNGALRLPITVVDVARVGAEAYPVTAVVPLPYGRYKDPLAFCLTNDQGHEIPAQFSALDRWWQRDGSIRHLAVDFQATLHTRQQDIKAGPTALYYLHDEASPSSAESSLQVEDHGDHIDVVTGPLRFNVRKDHFDILHKVWFDSSGKGIFDNSNLVLSADKKSGATLFGRAEGDIQRDRDRQDVSVTIEEAGPLRVIIRASAPTRYDPSTKSVTHGFATRIYAYAGKPYIKIDYQLQNTDKEHVYSAPLYFRGLSMDFPLRFSGEPTVRIGLGNAEVLRRPRGNGVSLSQRFLDNFDVTEPGATGPISQGSKAEGFMDVSDTPQGVATFVRFFSETWPNALKAEHHNQISVQPFPLFGAQRRGTGYNPAGLYWLSDMQNVYKEILLRFHDGRTTNRTLQQSAALLNQPPVAILPRHWYSETSVTLDLGGSIPLQDSRLPSKHAPYHYSPNDSAPKNYRSGWNDFYLIDPSRKMHPANAGGWPYGVARYVLSENPADVEALELFGIGEMNTRPQWLSNYRYASDFPRLQLGVRLGWQPASWRKDGENGGGYLPGTAPQALPRDDAHGWFYHVRESYYAIPNPWIKDWYKFMAEYRKALLDRHWDLPSRAVGHALASAVAALRITGDSELATLVHRDINVRRQTQQDPIYGFRNSLCCGEYGEAAFQAGFLARAVINFMEEVGEDSQAYADAFQFLSGIMYWNRYFSNFSYYLDARKGQRGNSNGTSLTLVDPQAWYYWHTGNKTYWDQIEDYLDGGINGAPPHGNFHQWNGQFEGRLYQWVKTQHRLDNIPPTPIRDLHAERSEAYVILRFTAPADAVRFHVVWGDKPIVEGLNTDPKKLNWWAAQAMPIPASPGSHEVKEQTVHIPLDTKYAAVFSFDSAHNMSSLSNVVAVNKPPFQNKPKPAEAARGASNL